VDKAAGLQQIADDIARDDPTPVLRQGAQQLVFGAGNPDAEIVFIGEAPGAKEDQLGEPFVGAAGKFLNEMLLSIGLTREQIYITNIVKYRPPSNRDPGPEEIKAFIPYLERQLGVIGPKLVAFLGRHSMNVFFPDLRISQTHGEPVHKDGQVYLPLYHPAAALYNGSMRQALLEDFAKIPAILKELNQPVAN
jgi:uracil-DNA glycosylase family 4